LLYKLMIQHKFNMEAVKLCLVSGEVKLFTNAIETLSAQPQVSVCIDKGIKYKQGIARLSR